MKLNSPFLKLLHQKARTLCLQPKHWKLYKPLHKTPLLFQLIAVMYRKMPHFAGPLNFAPLSRISAAGYPRIQRTVCHGGSCLTCSWTHPQNCYCFQTQMSNMVLQMVLVIGEQSSNETSWHVAYVSCNALSTTPPSKNKRRDRGRGT